MCPAPHLYNVALRRHDFYAQHVVRGDAVDQRMWSPRVFTHVAANRAGTLAAGVGHIVKALRVKRVAQVQIDQPGLHDRAQVVVIDLQDAVHARKRDHHAAINRNSPATQARTRPSWHNRHRTPSRDFDNRRHLFSRSR